jgi:hypothetical protein
VGLSPRLSEHRAAVEADGAAVLNRRNCIPISYVPQNEVVARRPGGIFVKP